MATCMSLCVKAIQFIGSIGEVKHFIWSQAQEKQAIAGMVVLR
jgi:hypothetical protein